MLMQYLSLDISWPLTKVYMIVDCRGGGSPIAFAVNTQRLATVGAAVAGSFCPAVSVDAYLFGGMVETRLVVTCRNFCSSKIVHHNKIAHDWYESWIHQSL